MSLFIKIFTLGHWIIHTPLASIVSSVKWGEISLKIIFQDYCLNELVIKALFKENGINEN